MKKIVGVFAAATMMFALPSVAMAAQFNSPSGTTVTDQSGVSISVSGDVTSASGNGHIDVNAGSTPAANVPAGVTPLATFEVVAEGDAEFTELTLVFSVGAQYAGANATVYITHGDGSNDVMETTVAADGTVAITVDRLSVFSIVVDESTVPADGEGVTTDTSATSPATGVVIAPVAAITAAAAAGAGAVAVTIRKKVTK